MALSRQMLLRKRRRRRAPVSGLEQKVRAWLDEAGISYQPQYAISRLHVDLFFAPDLVVEINGCYFHNHAKCKPKITKHNRTTVAKDKKRYAFLLNQGYQLLIFWECDLNSEGGKALVLDTLRKAGRS